MRKRIIMACVLAAIMATIALLSACSTPENAGDNSGRWYITTLNDPATGTKIRCAINGYSSKSGVSCDWEHPIKEKK